MPFTSCNNIFKDAKFFAMFDGVEIPIKVNSLSLNHSWDGVSHIELDGCIIEGTAYDPIERVIFNDPATIVIWKDGTKTVVKCQKGDTFSKELGLAMAISKKFFSNKGKYNEVFKKWTKEDE